MTSTQKAAFASFVLINSSMFGISLKKYANMLISKLFLISNSSFSAIHSMALQHCQNAEWWTCNFAGNVYFQKTNIVPVLTSIRRLI